MIWIQSEYDKSRGLERYFLRPNDWEDTWQHPETGMVLDCEYEAEWYGQVEKLEDGNWSAEIRHAGDEERDYKDHWGFEEMLSTREEAQAWVEQEIQPENLQLRQVEKALDRGNEA